MPPPDTQPLPAAPASPGAPAEASAQAPAPVPQATALPAFAPLVDGPCYAAIFASARTAAAPEDGYADMAERMVALAAGQPGFLGVDSARGADGVGITVSYWSSLEAMAAWRRHAEHRVARDTGRARWYSHYTLRVAKVERAYEMPANRARDPGEPAAG